MGIKQLNDLINEGYRSLQQQKDADACNKWGKAWILCKAVAQQHNITSLDQFDQISQLDQYVSNWIQDYEMALTNAALDDPGYYLLRKDFIADFLGGLGKDCDELIEHNMRRAMAESMFAIGECDQAESLFREWLDAEPSWGWGWINWADCWYLLGEKSPADLARGAEILVEGLDSAPDEEKEYFYERLVNLYTDMNDAEKATDAEALLKKYQKQSRLGSSSRWVKPVNPALERHFKPIRVEKVGRNQPCPCGSGKKYKKCCGKDI